MGRDYKKGGIEVDRCHFNPRARDGRDSVFTFSFSFPKLISAETARILKSGIENAESKVSEIKDTASGVIRICASDTVSTHFLLPYIKEYHQKYPNVNLILQNGTSSETIELLKNNKGDIGFVNLPIDDTDINLSNTVMQLHDTFVCSDKFKELTDGVVDLKRLQDYPLLMLELSTATRQAIVGFAHSQGIHLHPEIELASLELMTMLAKNGIGIACIPREFVKHELGAACGGACVVPEHIHACDLIQGVCFP